MTTTVDLYAFRVEEVVRVVDGDTYDLHVDLGFHARFSARFRLAGWDTPELRGGSDFEKAKAVEASSVAQSWFEENAGNVLVRTVKADSFGRWLASPFTLDASGEYHLATVLDAECLAVEWPLRWHEVHSEEKP